MQQPTIEELLTARIVEIVDRALKPLRKEVEELRVKLNEAQKKTS